MDNPYDGYVAMETFEVKADYDDEPSTIVKQGEVLLFSRKLEETWEFVHNDRYIYVPVDIVTKNLKIYQKKKIISYFREMKKIHYKCL